MKLPPRSTFLFIGDSITDADRDPNGEELANGTRVPGGGLGIGYVSMVNAWLRATYPQTPVRVVNRGTSGHNVRDLKARWQKDVLDAKPDWLAIMIGINDVWRQFDTPLQAARHVLPDEYERTLDGLLAETKPKIPGGVVLATPYFIEFNPTDAMRRRMDEYGGIVKTLAAKHGTILVDTQAAFDEVLIHTHPMYLAWDRIHPGPTGHMVLARAFLRAVKAL